MFSLKLGLNLSQEAKKKSRPTGASQQLMAAESDEDTVSSHDNMGRGWGDVQMSSRVQQEEVSPMAASFHDDVSDITDDRFTEAGTEVGGEEVYA